MSFRENAWSAAVLVYSLGATATMVQQTFLDCFVYTWFNWLYVLPINAFLAGIWPIYWAILRPIFGGGCHH